EDFDAVIGELRRPGNLEVAVVTEGLPETAQVFVRGLGPVEVRMPALEWAAPAQSSRTRGPAPTQPADVLQAGDVILLRRDAEIGWRLAQTPEVQGALVALDPQDGAVVALVGGYDYFLSKYN